VTQTFEVSNDPEFAVKLEAIVGLCLSPPEHGILRQECLEQILERALQVFVREEQIETQ
jgi:hypothetical protein